MSDTRLVRDSLGELEVPADAYYGAQTARAIENFPISGPRLPHAFIRAQGIVKWAAAKAHRQLGVMDERKAEAICRAAEEVMAGSSTGGSVWTFIRLARALLKT